MSEQDLTLRGMLHRVVERYPQNEAVVDADSRYTYTELLDRVQRMAKLLHVLGVRKGDRVALLMPPSANHFITLFGAVELGAIPCALHVRESEGTLAALLQRLAPRVMVYDGAYRELARVLCKHCGYVTGLVCSVSSITPEGLPEERTIPVIPRDLDQYRLDFEPMPVNPDDTAVIALSSGTTGIPKGIMHSHRTLVASGRCGAPYMLATSSACAINVFSTAFIGWYNCTLPFVYGASKIVYLNQWSPQDCLHALHGERVTVCFLVPTMWRMLLREKTENYDLSALERVGYAGEPMDLATMVQIRERICANVINTYGTTETGSWGGCTVMLPEDYADEDKIASVGKPGTDVKVRIVTPGGDVDDVKAAGEEGEVIFSGPSVADQLWEQPELARRIFENGWWRSGDMGVMERDGYLYLRGRIDDMIISGGINVMPSQVEDTVLGHPAVSECVVIGVPDEQWGQQITAFVACKEEVTAAELAEFVDQSPLSGYKKPREYRFVDELPRGNTGKVSRKLLRDQVMGRQAS